MRVSSLLVCACMCVHVRVCVRLRVCTYVHASMFVCACMHMRFHVCKRTCMRDYVCICVYVIERARPCDVCACVILCVRAFRVFDGGVCVVAFCGNGCVCLLLCVCVWWFWACTFITCVIILLLRVCQCERVGTYIVHAIMRIFRGALMYARRWFVCVFMCPFVCACVFVCMLYECDHCN